MTFDDRVREYRIKKGDLSHIKKCEFLNIPMDNLIGHEIFPGRGRRSACIYSKHGIAMIAPIVHNRFHFGEYNKEDFILTILKNKLNVSDNEIVTYFLRMRLNINSMNLKPYRIAWGMFDARLKEGLLWE